MVRPEVDTSQAGIYWWSQGVIVPPRTLTVKYLRRLSDVQCSRWSLYFRPGLWLWSGCSTRL